MVFGELASGKEGLVDMIRTDQVRVHLVTWNRQC
jgi:hypothetical protein